MRTSVHIPDDLLKRAKKKAAAEGRTLTSLIEEGLRLVVTPRASAGHKKRKMPRFSRAKGGLMPGIDPVKVLQHADEMDDIEYVRRMRTFK